MFFYKFFPFRYLRFQEMAAKGVIDPNKLPPTDEAAYQHCLRAFYQTAVWKSLDPFCLEAGEWGWSHVDGFYSPVMNSVDCAPENLLKFVRCKCKAGCSSSLCSCRKHGLSCVPACKNCHGDCENCTVSELNLK